MSQTRIFGNTTQEEAAARGARAALAWPGPMGDPGRRLGLDLQSLGKRRAAVAEAHLSVEDRLSL